MSEERPQYGLPERDRNGEFAGLVAALRDVVSAARRGVDALEDENYRLHRELDRIHGSKGRRLWLTLRTGLRRAGSRLRHPAATVGSMLRGRAFPRWLDDALAAWERLRFERQPLRLMPPLDRRTDSADLFAAIRWIGPIRVGGRSREALFCHPTSRIVYRTPVATPARIVAWCALMPQVWNAQRGGVEFELSVRIGDAERAERRTIVMDPDRNPGDRRWRRLVLPVAAAAGAETPVTISLATRVPPGVNPEYAWAVWGEPSVERRRSREGRARLSRSFISRVRRGGLRSAGRLLVDARASDGHAAAYRRWLAQHTPGPEALERMAAEVPALKYRPLISIITPVYNTDPRWLHACVESVRRQVYPDWQLCLCDDASPAAETRAALAQYEGDPRIRITRLEKNSQISAASNAALAMATGEFIAMLDHDDELPPWALFEVARFLNEHPDADMVYSDEDKLEPDGRRSDPYFKPDWSPEHFLTCMYSNHLMVLRRSLVHELGAFRVGYEGSQDYDLVLRLMERTARIHHIPKILYHWRKIPGSVATVGSAKPWAMDAGRKALEDYARRSGRDADVLPGGGYGLYRMKFRIKEEPLVSIVIPTDGRNRRVGSRDLNLVLNCVQSIVLKTAYPRYEIVVVDNGTLPGDTLAFLATVPHRRVSYRLEGRFNFAHKINFCARHAKGEHLVLMNDDIEVISSEWLSAMLEYSQQPEIGAVGAKLYFPDGRLQHIGIVLGVNGMAAHAFHMAPGSSVGYASSAVGVRNYSAVTAACLMTRRALFEEFGGFDERFRFDFNDVDYCLRLRRAGYRVVFTPYAELYHHESATEGGRTWDPDDVEEMKRRWAVEYERDPYYNSNLTRDYSDYRLRL